MLKFILLKNIIILYFIGKKIQQYQGKLQENTDNLPLTHKRLIKISNTYQMLTKKWILTEKRILFLQGFIRMKSNLKRL